MTEDLDKLCAQRDALFADIERLEAEDGTDSESLRLARVRLAALLHRINDAAGVPDL
jgi:hypothetical protein